MSGKSDPHIVIPDRKRRLGDTRSEQHENLVKEGWSGGLSGEQAEKIKYLEKKFKNEFTTGGKIWFSQRVIKEMVK